MSTSSDSLKKSTQNACVICFENFTTQRVATLICGHIFCFKCLLEWSSRKENCPVCETSCTEIHDYLKRIENFGVNWYNVVENIPELPITEYHDVNEISNEKKNSSMTEDNEMDLEEPNNFNNGFIDERYEQPNSEDEMDEICDNMVMTSIVDFDFSDFD